MDFCLKRKGGSQIWTALLETKFINGNRDYVDEILRDLLRLWSQSGDHVEAAAERYLLVAGSRKDIEEQILTKEYNSKSHGKRRLVFQRILPTASKTLLASVGTAKGTLKPRWNTAANRIGLQWMPSKIKLERLADRKTSEFECLVWRVRRVQNDTPVEVR